METNVYVIIAITIIIIIIVISLVYFYKKENLDKDPGKYLVKVIKVPDVSTAPVQIQNALAIQQRHANNLGADIASKNSNQLAIDLTAIITSQESTSGGLSSFDYYHGTYLGNWTMENDSFVPECFWTYTGILSSDNPNATTVSSTNILLPPDYPQNCYWTLYPNHSAGNPVLRKLTTTTMSQYENDVWVVIDNF